MCWTDWTTGSDEGFDLCVTNQRLREHSAIRHNEDCDLDGETII